MKKLFLYMMLIFSILTLFACQTGPIDGLYIKKVSKTEYYQYATFDVSTVEATIVESGIERKLDVTSDMIYGFDSNTVTDNLKVTLKYAGKSAYFTVKIKPLTINPTSITVTCSSNFYLNSSFEATVLATYTIDGKKISLKIPLSECTITGFNSSTEGENVVTISYKNISVVKNLSISKDLQNIVKTKYNTSFNPNTNAQFRDIHCHDPKLFQDDDGTYYVYSTDASCGYEEYSGIVIRKSTDLVNWEGVGNSAIQGFWDEDFLAWEGFIANSTETKHKAISDYGAVTWAPSVIKQNGLYYMYHGVSANVLKTSGETAMVSSIVLAIATKATGPFYPCDVISNFNEADYSNTTVKGKKYLAAASDIKVIKATLESLGVRYDQSFLVRHIRDVGANDSSVGKLDGIACPEPDYTKSLNGRFGCIDPEFVYDVSTGNLMEYTINGNVCYALNYGSWMDGIAVVYVDKVSLKPIYKDYSNGTKTSITIDGVTYNEGEELNVPLDYANYVYYGSSSNGNTGNTGCLGTRVAGRTYAGYEGAQVIYSSETGYYYVFVSMGDLNYEYRVGCGRSENLMGPYKDASGYNMELSTNKADVNYWTKYHAIGSKIIGASQFADEYGFRCQGGQSILRTSAGKIIFACHTRTNFRPGYFFYLQCRQLFFTKDGWPVLNQNEYYNEYSNYTSDAKETLTPIAPSKIAGNYDVILTERGTESSIPEIFGESLENEFNTKDAAVAKSKKMTLSSDGKISGAYTGTWTLDSDGYSITLEISQGTFKGYVMHAVDFARKNSTNYRTIHITSLCSDTNDLAKGEYLFANKEEYQLTLPYVLSGTIPQDTTVPPLNAITEETGLSISFDLSGYTSDWSMVFLTANGNIGLTDLHYCENSVWKKNAWINSNQNGNSAYDVFLNKDCRVKIVFFGNQIEWYKDDVKVCTYNTSGGYSSDDNFPAIADYVKGIINAVSSMGMTVHTSDIWANAESGTYTMSNLTIDTAN